MNSAEIAALRKDFEVWAEGEYPVLQTATTAFDWDSANGYADDTMNAMWAGFCAGREPPLSSVVCCWGWFDSIGQWCPHPAAGLPKREQKRQNIANGFMNAAGQRL